MVKGGVETSHGPERGRSLVNCLAPRESFRCSRLPIRLVSAGLGNLGFLCILCASEGRRSEEKERRGTEKGRTRRALGGTGPDDGSMPSLRRVHAGRKSWGSLRDPEPSIRTKQGTSLDQNREGYLMITGQNNPGLHANRLGVDECLGAVNSATVNKPGLEGKKVMCPVSSPYRRLRQTPNATVRGWLQSGTMTPGKDIEHSSRQGQSPGSL